MRIKLTQDGSSLGAVVLAEAADEAARAGRTTSEGVLPSKAPAAGQPASRTGATEGQAQQPQAQVSQQALKEPSPQSQTRQAVSQAPAGVQ